MRNPALERLWDAVEAAYLAGVTPRQIVQEIAESYAEANRRQAKDHADAFSKMLGG